MRHIVAVDSGWFGFRRRESSGSLRPNVSPSGFLERPQEGETQVSPFLFFKTCCGDFACGRKLWSEKDREASLRPAPLRGSSGSSLRRAAVRPHEPWRRDRQRRTRPPRAQRQRLGPRRGSEWRRESGRIVQRLLSLCWQSLTRWGQVLGENLSGFPALNGRSNRGRVSGMNFAVFGRHSF
jgi:hypothetical protein